MTEHFFHIEGVAAALTIIAFGAAFVRMVARNTALISRTIVLVDHLYSNFMPHTESYLRKISEKLEIEYEDPKPPPTGL